MCRCRVETALYNRWMELRVIFCSTQSQKPHTANAVGCKCDRCWVASVKFFFREWLPGGGFDGRDVWCLRRLEGQGWWSSDCLWGVCTLWGLKAVIKREIMELLQVNAGTDRKAWNLNSITWFRFFVCHKSFSRRVCSLFNRCHWFTDDLCHQICDDRRVDLKTVA